MLLSFSSTFLGHLFLCQNVRSKHNLISRKLLLSENLFNLCRVLLCSALVFANVMRFPRHKWAWCYEIGYFWYSTFPKYIRVPQMISVCRMRILWKWTREGRLSLPTGACTKFSDGAISICSPNGLIKLLRHLFRVWNDIEMDLSPYEKNKM